MRPTMPTSQASPRLSMAPTRRMPRVHSPTISVPSSMLRKWWSSVRQVTGSIRSTNAWATQRRAPVCLVWRRTGAAMSTSYRAMARWRSTHPLARVRALAISRRMIPTPSAGSVPTPVAINVTMTMNQTVASTESIRRSIADAHKNAAWFLIGLLLTRLPYGQPQDAGEPANSPFWWGLSPLQRSGVTALALLLRCDDPGECVVQFLGLGIVHRDDQASTALKRNAHNNEPTLLDCLHWSVAGPRFHGRHEWSPFVDVSLLSRMRAVPINRHHFW